jgi:hypothetical protein
MDGQTRPPHYSFVYAPRTKNEKSKLTDSQVILRVIAEANIKTAVWNFTPCSLVDIIVLKEPAASISRWTQI